MSPALLLYGRQFQASISTLARTSSVFSMTMFRLPALVAWVSVGLVILSTPACRLTDMPLWPAPRPFEARSFEVKQVAGIAYCEAALEDDCQQRLDLYLPKDAKEYPTILLVHG